MGIISSYNSLWIISNSRFLIDYFIKIFNTIYEKETLRSSITWVDSDSENKHLLLSMITAANPAVPVQESNTSMKRSTHPLQRNLLILIVRFCAIHLQDKNT